MYVQYIYTLMKDKMRYLPDQTKTLNQPVKGKLVFFQTELLPTFHMFLRDSNNEAKQNGNVM